MVYFLKSIERIENIDWGAFRSKATSRELIEKFEVFKQSILKTKSALGIVHDPKNDRYPRFSVFFNSLAEILHPDLETPTEIVPLCEKIASELNVRAGQYAILGCRAYVMWAYMQEKYGSPQGIAENPFETMVEFFEEGGMYQAEHNMHVGYF